MTTLNSQGLISIWYDGVEGEDDDKTHRGHMFVASVEDFVRILYHFGWTSLSVWDDRPFTEERVIGWIRHAEEPFKYEWWVKT